MQASFTTTILVDRTPEQAFRRDQQHPWLTVLIAPEAPNRRLTCAN